MSQTAKAQEPSMEEILASIRRIIADDDAAKPPPPKPAVAAPPPPPKPAAAAPPPPPAPPPSAGISQDEVDAMLAAPGEAEPAEPAVPEPPPMPAAPPPTDVLDLTEAMAAPPEPEPEPAPSFRTIDAAADVVFTDRMSEPAPVMPEPQVEEPPSAYTPPATPDPALLSDTTAAAVDRAFNSLAHTVLGNNARTLEDLVKEMLRPMLKGWLDDNLPSMVERIVRSEIERVSRGH